jgi:fibro-slime domain-containing protein
MKPAAPDMTRPEAGFILIFVMILLLGISAIGMAMLRDAKLTTVAAGSYKQRLKAFYASDGMMVFLSNEIVAGRDSLYRTSASKGTLTGTIWSIPGGSDVKSFRSRAQSGGMGAGYPIPSSSLGSILHNGGFQGHPEFKDDYGIMWRGYVEPPVSGNYTFFVRADDESEFFLSTSEKPGNLSPSPIAYNYASMSDTRWPSALWSPKGSEYKTVSKPRLLKAGNKYYFEYYHSERGGNDFGQVGWSGPDWLTEKPIPGSRLSNLENSNGGGGGSGGFTAQVGGTTVKYDVQPLGEDVFNVSTEGFATLGGDTLFRSPLTQVLSLKSDNAMPPDTMWVKVLFYDYHSDRSNPEFEAPGGVHNVGPHMVRHDKMRKTTVNADFFGLDSIGKPIRTNNMDSVKYSCALDRWFDPWVAGDAANKWVPRYDSSVENDCTPVATANDTMFKNVVLKDSLPMIYQPDVGSNTYLFARSGGWEDSGFFWIDGKGLGSEGRPRNYSYCMESHSKFNLYPGMLFDFSGDDDVWLFIDDKLVVDLGGTHTSMSAKLYIDDLGLNPSTVHTFDFFYCERHTVQSTIRLTTNLPIGKGKPNVTSNWRRSYGNLD